MMSVGRYVVLLVMLAMLVWGSTVHASECTGSHTLKPGEKAPCGGTLMPDGDMRFYYSVEDKLTECNRLTKSLQIDLRVAAADKVECEELAAIDKKTADDKQAACLSRWSQCEKVVLGLKPTVDETPSAYEKPGFWLGVAMAAGALTLGLANDDAGKSPITWGVAGLGIGLVIGGEL